MNNSQNTQGQLGYMPQPLSASYVPPDVVTKVQSKYNSVYDITCIKHTADQNAYVVRYLDSGIFKTEIVGEDGTTKQ